MTDDPDHPAVETFQVAERQQVGCGHVIERGADIVTVRQGDYRGPIIYQGCDRCYAAFRRRHQQPPDPG